MPSAAVYTTTKAQLDANPITGFPFYGPDSIADAPWDKATFVAYEFPVATSEQITFGSPGSNTFRETGSLRFIIAARRGPDDLGNDGFSAGLATAEALRVLFRNYQQGGLKFWEPSPPVTDDQNASGAYYRLTVAVPYWYDFWA